jgi:hypothetical protein
LIIKVKLLPYCNLPAGKYPPLLYQKESIPYVFHLLLVPDLDKFHFFLGIIGLYMHIYKVLIFRKFHFSITSARLSKAEVFYPTGGRDRLPFGQSLRR